VVRLIIVDAIDVRSCRIYQVAKVTLAGPLRQQLKLRPLGPIPETGARSTTEMQALWQSRENGSVFVHSTATISGQISSHLQAA
jgi:hypothetical protein